MSVETYAEPVRQHPRVEAGFVVKLLSSHRAVLARAVDLSMAGMALYDPAGELQRHAFDRVAIQIPGEGSELVLPIQMVRRMGDRVGLTFTALDWDDLFALARYLSPRLDADD